LSIWIGVWRSADVEPRQNHDGLDSILDLSFDSRSASPNVQKEPLSIVQTGKFIAVVSSRRNGDDRWRTQKVLSHLHELLGFSLGKHRSHRFFGIASSIASGSRFSSLSFAYGREEHVLAGRPKIRVACHQFLQRPVNGLAAAV
jgi:hypothetical protein